jgi:mannose-6-phosphate isomerase-like protein (cupin superfamily)
MSGTLETPASDLEELHAKADAMQSSFGYQRPTKIDAARGSVALAKTDLMRARVVILPKGKGENNLHYHTDSDSLWLVIKGKVAFYGPGDKLIGEFGPMEGTTTPRYFRYWFANCGEEDLEMLHVFAYARPGQTNTGRTDAAPRKDYVPQSGQQFVAMKE